MVDSGELGDRWGIPQEGFIAKILTTSERQIVFSGFPAKNGRLWPFYSCEVDDWLSEVHLCTLSTGTSDPFQHSNSDENE